MNYPFQLSFFGAIKLQLQFHLHLIFWSSPPQPQFIRLPAIYGNRVLLSSCAASSIGNVGQLAVDLLISTLKVEKIGYLDDSNVVPCVGNNAYWPSPAGDLALPLEVYESSSHGLTFIQQISPIVKGMLIQFAKNISDFAAANGKKHVVVISGLDFMHRAKLDTSRNGDARVQ